jgi:DNA-directed RNA polymerase specialized sigma24 family protein
MSRDHASAEDRLRRRYAEHVDPILGFAMRRVDQADDAADIVAETFQQRRREVALASWKATSMAQRVTVTGMPGTVAARSVGVPIHAP